MAKCLIVGRVKYNGEFGYQRPTRSWPVSMRAFGQILQRLGLFLPPVAIVLELSERVSLGQMLALLAFSVCLFGIGRIVEGYGRN